MRALPFTRVISLVAAECVVPLGALPSFFYSFAIFIFLSCRCVFVISVLQLTLYCPWALVPASLCVSVALELLEGGERGGREGGREGWREGGRERDRQTDRHRHYTNLSNDFVLLYKMR
jgi:hypothetical protein